MKRKIVFGVILLSIITTFISCSKYDGNYIEETNIDNIKNTLINAKYKAIKTDDYGEVTLKNIENTLVDAGYTIIKEISDEENAPENLIGGFLFVLNGAHGSISIPVLEFKDEESADAYAQRVNITLEWIDIKNDNFLTMVEAHNGVAHDSETIFLENLLNGKSIK